MRKLLITLLALTSISAFANEFTPAFANQLAQALYHNSQELTDSKALCGTDPRSITSEELSAGIYKHTLQIYEGARMRGSVHTCTLIIVQDYTPTYVDGPIEYEFKITEILK